MDSDSPPRVCSTSLSCPLMQGFIFVPALRRKRLKGEEHSVKSHREFKSSWDLLETVNSTSLRETGTRTTTEVPAPPCGCQMTSRRPPAVCSKCWQHLLSYMRVCCEWKVARDLGAHNPQAFWSLDQHKGVLWRSVPSEGDCAHRPQ